MSVDITELRANLLKYLTKAQRGEQITVISGGQRLATIVAPIDQKQRAKTEFKRLSKTAKIHDVISPTGVQWDAISLTQR